MYFYYLEIAKLNIKLQSTYPVLLDERMKPFLSDKQSEDIPADILYYLTEEENHLGEASLLYECSAYCIYETEDKRYRVNKGGTTLLEREKKMSCISKLTGQRLGGNQLLCYLALEEPLLVYSAFYLHASFVKWKEKGIVFTGNSGVGKSTQADLWKQYMGADIINGDKTIIRRHVVNRDEKEENSYRAYGSIYAGSSDIYRQESASVTAIVLLEQAEDNVLLPLKGGEAFRHLYAQTLSNSWNEEFAEKITEELIILMKHVPIYKLRCRPDVTAVEIMEKEIENL